MAEWHTLLSAQLRSPVRWRQSAQSLAAIMRAGEWDGDNLFCELGPGGHFSAHGQVPPSPEATTLAISVPDDLDTLVATLTGETSLHTGSKATRASGCTFPSGSSSARAPAYSSCLLARGQSRTAPNPTSVAPTPGAAIAPTQRYAYRDRRPRGLRVGHRGKEPLCRGPHGRAGPPGRARPTRPTHRLAASPLMTEHGCSITGWASALPRTVVTNQDIMTLFDTSDEWIVERTGIRQRRAADGPFVNPKPAASPPNGMGTTAQLAVEAGKGALEMAGLSGERHRPADPVHDHARPDGAGHFVAAGERPLH